MSYVALWALVVFQCLLILFLLEQLAKLRRFAVGGGFSVNLLPEGSKAPDFANVDKHSTRQVGLRSLDGTGGVILFLSSECLVCRGLVDRLALFGADESPLIIAFCQGRERGCARFGKRLGTRFRFVVDAAGETAARYRISTFPTAVVVDGKQRIRGYGYPSDVRDIKEMCSRILARVSPDAGREHRVPSPMLTT
jgi:hypothetical protein